MADGGAPARLRTISLQQGPKLARSEGTAIEAALTSLEDQLAGYAPAATPPAELTDEWRAMRELYRAVRRADANMQALLRSSEVGDRLTRLYYRLRSIQGGLAMAYAVAGPGLERPETSPVGTAIGLYDAPKVLAQETHLVSGSYDRALPSFAGWMQEIWTDLAVRQGDYLRFYGEPDVAEARAALRRILGLDTGGAPHHYKLLPNQPDDPARLQHHLERLASDPADLVGAARAIQETSQQARLRLISLLAHHDHYAARQDETALQRAAETLRAVIDWPFPVGTTPHLNLAAEQEGLDALLDRLAEDPAALAGGRGRAAAWAGEARAALRRACIAEQSLRSHSSAYPDFSQRRSFRWYIWEFLNLIP